MCARSPPQTSSMAIETLPSVSNSAPEYSTTLGWRRFLRISISWASACTPARLLCWGGTLPRWICLVAKKDPSFILIHVCTHPNAPLPIWQTFAQLDGVIEPLGGLVDLRVFTPICDPKRLTVF